MGGMNGKPRIATVIEDDGERDVRAGPQPWVSRAVREEALPSPAYLRGELQRAAYTAEDGKRRRENRDTLLRLYDARRITRHELRAAHELLVIIAWSEELSAVLARSQLRERLAASTDGFGPGWLSMLEAEHTRYIPWREWARDFQICADPEGTVEDLTRLVVVGEAGSPPRGVEPVATRFRMGHVRCLAFLRRSLHWYAAKAGWTCGENPEPIAA